MNRTVSAHHNARRRGAAWTLAIVFILSLHLAGSCARNKSSDGPALKENIYGFFLGQAKEVVFDRAAGISTITKAPDPPLGYRGELWNFSRPLETSDEVGRVRCAFLDDRLMEVVVYFRDTSRDNLDALKVQLEGRFRAHAVAEDGKLEMAQKTYRLTGPGMSITLRRITKRDETELYVQYLHDELHTKLIEMNKTPQETRTSE
jgi:hypothetical protein